jgi:hypothetical protein
MIDHGPGWHSFAARCAVDTDVGGSAMMTPRLERMIEHVKELSPDELRQLRDMVDDLLPGSHPRLSEDQFEERLVGLGVIRVATAPIVHAPVDRDFQPVEVRGEPVSETIVEERR